MTKVLLSSLVLFFSITTFANKPLHRDYLEDKYMQIINLEGLQIINSDKQNELIDAITTVTSEANANEVKARVETDYRKIISGVYGSEVSGLYAFVTKNKEEPTEYSLVIAKKMPSTNWSVLYYGIVGASSGSLRLVHGPSDEQEKETAVKTVGSFFPY